MLGKPPVLSAIVVITGPRQKRIVVCTVVMAWEQREGNRLGINYTCKSNKICWWIELGGRGKGTG